MPTSAFATRASTSKIAARPARVAVRPVAKLNVPKAAALVAVSAGVAALAVAPAEAANLISTVASAAEGYPFVPPEWLPSVLVPTVGLVVPALTMAALFTYIEKEV
eukprot:gene14094-20048_t